MKAPREPSLSRIVTEEDIGFYVQQFKKSGFRYTEWCPEHRRGCQHAGLLCSGCRAGPVPAPTARGGLAAPASLPPVVGGEPSQTRADGEPLTTGGREAGAARPPRSRAVITTSLQKETPFP